MKYLFVTLFLLCSCGSGKEFTRSNSIENLSTIEHLNADLYRETKLLELLDIKIRQMEIVDTFGNVRKETSIDINKKMNKQDFDTTKMMRNKQQTDENVVRVETKEERSGVIGFWVWIVGFIAIISIMLVVGVYLIKKTS